MDFVHVLNLLLWAIVAPSRTFSTFIWSLAAQSSRRAAQSMFNHGDRFKSTFRKASESHQGASTSAWDWIKNKDRKRPVGRRTHLQPSSCSTGWFPVHWESTYFFPVYVHSVLLHSCISSNWLRGFVVVAVAAVQWRCTGLYCAAQSRVAATPFTNTRTSEGIPSTFFYECGKIKFELELKPN